MWRSSRLGLLVSASPARRSLIVEQDTRALRCELGTTSWVVLEEMLLCSTGDVDDCRAAVSIRKLGASVIDYRAIHRTEDTIGNIGRSRYLQKMTTGMHSSLFFDEDKNR